MSFISANNLWMQVMKNEIQLHGDKERKKWKISSNIEPECIKCDEINGNVLIKCSNDSCGCYMHLECANEATGLFLSGDGILRFECPKHFQDILFCSCKQRYDNSQPMIFCNECLDWYHVSCENIDPSIIETLPTYQCKSCTAILSQGKKIPKQLKDKNNEKDARSGDSQNALKIIGLLAEISSAVCPVIDSLNRDSTDRYKSHDINEILGYLELPPFPCYSKEQVIITEDMQAEIDLFNTLGVNELVQQWYVLLLQFRDNLTKWKRDFMAIVNNLTILEPALSLDHIGLVQQSVDELKHLEVFFQTNFHLDSSEIEFYLNILDIIVWIQDIYQSLNHLKPENFNTQITSLIKSSNSKLKKLLISSKSTSETLEVFLPWIQNYVKKIQESLSTLIMLHNKTNSLINNQEQISLEEFNQYLSIAKNFPSMPFYQSLIILRSDSEKFEEEAKIILDKSELDEEELQNLNEKFESSPIDLPSHEMVQEIMKRAVFIKAYQLALDEKRLSFDGFQSLMQEASSLEYYSTSHEDSDKPNLFLVLDSKIQGLINELKENYQLAQEKIKLFDINAFNKDMDYSEILEQFKQLLIITQEEEFLTFHKLSLSFSKQINDYLSSSSLISVQELDSVHDSVNNLLENSVVDNFLVTKEMKQELTHLISALNDLKTSGLRHWSILSNALDDLKGGVAVSYELFSEHYEMAMKSRVVDYLIQPVIKQALEHGISLEQECLTSLELINEVNPANLKKAEELLDIVHNNPIPLNTANKIRLRYDTWKTVLCCKDYLSQTDLKYSEKDLVNFRELRNSILKLSSQLEPSSIESPALETIREDFLLLSWTSEVNFIFASNQKTMLHKIENLVQVASEKTKQSKEWEMLQNELTNIYSVMTQVQMTKKDFDELLSQLGPEDIEETPLPEELTNILAPVIDKEALVFFRKIDQWLSEAKELVQSLDSANQVLAQSHIIPEQITPMLIEMNDFFQLMNQNIRLMKLILVKAFPQVDLSLIFDSQNVNKSDFIDMKIFQSFLQKSNLLFEKYPSFWVIAKTQLILERPFVALTKWLDQGQILIPQIKSTRFKSRNDFSLPSLDSIHLFLSDPIALAIQTPFHDSIYRVLNDVQKIRSDLTSFLLSSSQTKLTIHELIFSDMSRLNELKQQIDWLPVDTPEAHVVQWVYNLFNWLEKVPVQSSQAEDEDQLTISEAQEYLLEAKPFIRELSSNIVSTLCNLNALNYDEASKPSGFTNQVHYCIRVSGEIYDQLEVNVEKCVEFQDRLKTAIESSNQDLKLLNALHEEGKTLRVIPDSILIKTLEKVIAELSAPPSILKEAPQKEKISKSKRKFASDEVSTGQSSAESNLIQLDKEREKVREKEREKEKEKLAQLREKEKEIKETEKEKQSKKTKFGKCPFIDCDKDIYSRLEVSTYCSDECFTHHISGYFKQMVAYKNQLFQKYDKHPGFYQSFDHNDYIAISLKDSKDFSKEKKNPAIHLLLQRLPTVAASVILPQDSKDSHASTPKSKSIQSLTTMDKELRNIAKVTFEEFFINKLKESNNPAALFAGELLALDLEDGLYRKYLNSSKTDPNQIPVLDRKEYKKHTQMLLLNLKQSHNVYIFEQLAKNIMSIDQLLAMSSQQLADVSLLKLREEQLQQSIEGSQRKSMQEELEEKRRETMAGEAEVWRYGGESAAAVPKTETVAEISKTLNTNGSTDQSTPKSPKSPKEESSGQRIDEIEQKVLFGKKDSESQKASKRPIDYSAGSRFITDRPRKQLKIETTNSKDEDDDNSSKSPRKKTLVYDSPKSKAPNLLEILKSKMGDNLIESDDTMPEDEPAREMKPLHMESSKPSPKTSHQHHPHQNPLNKPLPQIRLLSDNGTESFSVTHPNSIGFKCSGLINDKRVQGCVKNTFNIDGRTRIAELDRFLNELLSVNRKIVATAVFLVDDGSEKSTQSSYIKFCADFTRDQRAGMCNISSNIQVYLIPPELKNAVHLLKQVEVDQMNLIGGQGIIFGCVVTKEPGPSSYSDRSYPILPCSVSSFSNFVGSSSTINSTKEIPSKNIPQNLKPEPVVPLIVPVKTDISPKIAPIAQLYPSQVPPLNPMNYPRPNLLQSQSQPRGAPINGYNPIQPRHQYPVGNSAPQGNYPPTTNYSRPNAFGPGAQPQMLHGQQHQQPMNNFQRKSAFDNYRGPNNNTQQPIHGYHQGNAPETPQNFMKQIAEICATEGVSKLNSLKSSPNSFETMPFLFEGNPGHEYFMDLLKYLVGLKQIGQQSARNNGGGYGGYEAPRGPPASGPGPRYGPGYQGYPSNTERRSRFN